MKTLLLTLVTAAAFCGCVHAQTNTAPAPVVLADTANPGVVLTAEQTAKLDNGVNSLLPLVPAKYQPAIISLILVLGVIGKFGRFFAGFLSGKNFADGLWQGVKSNIFGSATVKAILLATLAAFAFTGCKTYQLVESTSATGVDIKASVPVPGTSGTLIGLSLMGGTWKETTVLQPTQTNGVL